MKLLVGLGNVGKKYENTYHNVGFQCIDWIYPNIDWKEDSKYLGFVAKSPDFILLKPTTFMNLSGQSVQKTMRYYQISLDHVIVFHDDSDIALGEYKIQTDRGSGGHRGVQSIIATCGGKAMTRVRIGIRAPEWDGLKANDFVLRRIPADHQQTLSEVYAEIQDKLQNI